LRSDQQPDPAQHVAGEPVRQGGEQRSVGRGELDLLTAQMPLQDGDLMSESEDLRLLGAPEPMTTPARSTTVGTPLPRKMSATSARDRICADTLTPGPVGAGPPRYTIRPTPAARAAAATLPAAARSTSSKSARRS